MYLIEKGYVTIIPPPPASVASVKGMINEKKASFIDIFNSVMLINVFM